jgi:hypothetical protein
MKPAQRVWGSAPPAPGRLGRLIRDVRRVADEVGAEPEEVRSTFTSSGDGDVPRYTASIRVVTPPEYS